MINNQFLYDLRSVAQHKNEVKSFKDSSGVILGRHLTAVDPELFRTVYDETTFLNGDFVFNNFGGYSNKIKKIKMNATGGFVNSTDNSSDTGIISLSGEDDEISVVERKSKIFYSDTQIEQAKMNNFNIVEQLLRYADELYKRDIDKAIATGLEDGKQKFKGLLNSDILPLDVATTTSKFSSLTGREMYQFVSDFISKQRSDVNNVSAFMPNVAYMPIAMYNALVGATFEANSGTKTVLGALEENFAGIKFFYSDHCGNVGGKSIFGVFSTNRQAIQIRIPVPLYFAPTFEKEFSYTTAMKARIAGADIINDKAGRLTEVVI